jgi:hypothetical protein
MKLLKAFGLFWYDFVIGDDWKIAVYVMVSLAIVGALAITDVFSDTMTVVVGTVLMMIFFALGVRHDARRSRS